MNSLRHRLIITVSSAVSSWWEQRSELFFGATFLHVSNRFYLVIILFLRKRSTSIFMVLTLIEGSAALHRLAHLRINSELTVSLILLLGISKIFGVRNTLVNTFCDSESLTRVCIINKLERQ